MLRIDKENGYYIDFCDSRCVALVQKVTLTRGNRKGETDFIVRGYYGSLQQLLNGYAAAVSREPAGSLKEVIYRLKKVQETIGAVSAMTKADFKELMIDEGKRVKSHE